MTVHNEEYKGYEIKIEYDECGALDPRDTFDNFGHMICFHSRYDLGDKHDLTVKEAKELMNREDVISLPLYLYDHSGITMNTTGFHCPWDSGQIGFTYVTKDEIRKEYGVKRISKKILKKVYDLLEGEVKIYDSYISGDVYGYLVEKDGDIVDSCGGFYGYKELDYMLEQAKSIVDQHVPFENFVNSF